LPDGVVACTSIDALTDRCLCSALRMAVRLMLESERAMPTVRSAARDVRVLRNPK